MATKKKTRGAKAKPAQPAWKPWTKEEQQIVTVTATLHEGDRRALEAQAKRRGATLEEWIGVCALIGAQEAN